MFLIINDDTPPTAENRADIIKLFDAIGVIHGEWFDDGRRWCGGCGSPRIVHACEPATMAEKMCNACHSIWPEHVDEFAEMLMDPDSDDDIMEMMNQTLN